MPASATTPSVVQAAEQLHEAIAPVLADPLLLSICQEECFQTENWLVVGLRDTLKHLQSTLLAQAPPPPGHPATPAKAEVVWPQLNAQRASLSPEVITVPGLTTLTTPLPVSLATSTHSAALDMISPCSSELGQTRLSSPLCQLFSPPHRTYSDANESAFLSPPASELFTTHSPLDQSKHDFHSPTDARRLSLRRYLPTHLPANGPYRSSQAPS
eukprot:NODE_4759_length_745_cov_14.001618_g4597_i0.p1 GENE.NODE_4759_length_745_cov_14.001618_g4597_i0~~NODE_4759_length_745_cov_14.001618_g4597_i0.p1  ORF type:complete len:214 (-),score=38.93 NODE_4759_length_745_cov_14.001618_g4597_i0:51-692(-)